MTDQEDGLFAQTAGGCFSQHCLHPAAQMRVKDRSACAHNGRRQVRFAAGFFNEQRLFCVAGGRVGAPILARPDGGDISGAVTLCAFVGGSRCGGDCFQSAGTGVGGSSRSSVSAISVDG